MHRKLEALSFQSNVHRFDIIWTETCSTNWTFAVTAFGDSLYTGIAEQVVALCDHNLKGEKISLRFNRYRKKACGIYITL